MVRKLIALLFLVGVATFVFVYAFDIKTVCERTLAYSIGQFDPRFGISEDEFKNAIEEASLLWEEASSENLFEYDPSAYFTINLTFDERQQKTIESDIILDQINDIEMNQESVEERYLTLRSLYDEKLEEYTQELQGYETALAEYNNQVAYWNGEGGAPEAEYQALQEERERLRKEANALESKQGSLNSIVESINTLVEENNQLAERFNKKVDSYNQIFGMEHFDKAEYLGNKINVYQFEGHDDLVFVLAHELGHALYLDHIDDPEAVMYFLIGDAESLGEIKLSQADSDALQAQCGIGDYDQKFWWQRIRPSDSLALALSWYGL